MENATTLSGKKPAAESDSPIPVLFFIFQTGNQANGGVESITQVIEGIQQVQPVVVTQRETPVNDRWRRAGAEVHVWSFSGLRRSGNVAETPGPNRWQQGAAVLRGNAAAYRLTRARRLPVVHCNDIRALWYAGWGAKAAGARLVFNVRDVKPPGESYDWKWRAATQLSDRILGLSQEMREALAQRLPPPFVFGSASRPPVDYIYSIVDFEKMKPAGEEQRAALRRHVGLSPGEVALAYVATFNEKKAQLRFIEKAGPQLHDRLPQATVYFIGDFRPEQDEYARRCRDAVHRLNLDDLFTFVGYSERVADWYRASDSVVLASRREGMARCMIEGLACGTPVVSFDVCSAREILEAHGCGRVVAQGAYEQLVGEMVRLAEATEEQRARMGRKGAQVARQHFGADQVTAQYETLYRKVGSNHFDRNA